MMSQKDRAADIERYRKKLEAQKEAEYQELKKATPAMPGTRGGLNVIVKDLHTFVLTN